MIRVVPAPFYGESRGGLETLRAAYGPFRLYRRARGALAAAFRALGLRSGDEVVVPSFLCPEALIPFERVGLQVAFYATDDELMPDWGDAGESLSSRTKAFLLYHPFGLPAPAAVAAEFCRSKGLLMIEDCAHALGTVIGERLAGTWGDAGAFSLRKFAPSPEGGMLLLRDSSRMPGPVPLAPSARWTRMKSFLRRAGERGSIPALLEIPLRYRERRAFEEPLPIRYADDGEDEDLAPAPSSERALDAFDFRVEREIRRERFCQWLQALADLRGAAPLYRELPEGASPYAFPVLLSDRAKAHRALLEAGISAEPTLNYPPLDYPRLRRREADYAKDERLARSALSLPVHSRVPPEAILRAVAALRGRS